MQFEFGDKFFEILMKVLELTIPEPGQLASATVLIRHLQDVSYLAVRFRLVVYDLGLQVHHHYYTTIINGVS